jgi:hypothetical protein
MDRWIIKRHGSNAANQSMRQVSVLGTVEAPDSESAVAAAAGRWTRYNNQYFEAVPLSGRTRKADREAAALADAMARLG